MAASPEHRGMTLRLRLGLVALVFLTMVLVAIGLSSLMLRSWNQVLHERADIRSIADGVSELRLAYSDQETGIRGYQLTGDPTFLEPYREGIVVEQIVSVRLREASPDLTGLDEGVALATSAGDAWRVEVADPTIDGTVVEPDDARASFDSVRAHLDDLDALVTTELIDLDDVEHDVRRNAFGVLIASAIVAIAGTALAASLFRRWVLSPLSEIRTAASSLIDDESFPIPQFDAPELDAVSTAVESLQRSLRHARDEAVANYDALEQSAVLAIQVRSELADELGDLPDGWRVHTLLQPAEGLVAGDCFDIGLLDPYRMYVVLIDVTGHGASVALNALKAKSQLRAALRSRRDPGAAISWLSSQLLKDAEQAMLTASVMVIDVTTGHVRYANGGHPPALMTDGDTIEPLAQPGPIIGAFEATWPTGETDLPRGSTILLHTDGITESLGDDRERFGDDRLHDCLTTTDPQALLTNIETAVSSFRVGTRTDDTTAIAIHRSDHDVQATTTTEGADETDNVPS